MKSINFLLFVLIVNLSFSQEKKSDLRSVYFNINIEENHYSSENSPMKIFSEIKFLEPLKVKNNSEGKFPLYDINETQILNKLENEEETVNNINSSFIFSESEIIFIQHLIANKLKETGANEILLSEFQIKNDLENKLFNNRIVFKDDLNFIYNINSKVEIQLGNNLEKFIRKINKTELDITLYNSLNLIAINF